MITPELLDKILLDWSYRLKDGTPDITDPEKVIVLNEILAENQLPLYEAGKETEDSTEVMVMYFCCVDDNKLDAVFDYFTNSKKGDIPTAKQKLDSAAKYGLTAENLGSTGKSSLDSLITDYNNGKIPRDHVAFVSGYTSARLIKSKYKSNISGKMITRGPELDNLKAHAMTLLKDLDITLATSEGDKWSPADFLIYNNGSFDYKSIHSLLRLQDPKNPEETLNGKFTTDISSKGGDVVGISLKAHIAQGGKATSFKKVLEKTTDYAGMPEALTAEDKAMTEFLYSMNRCATDKPDPQTIGYYVDLLDQAKKIPGNTHAKLVKEVITALQQTFSAAAIKKLLSISNAKDRKLAVRALWKKSGKSEISNIKNVIREATKYNATIIEKAFKTYDIARKTFYDVCSKRNYIVTPTNSTKEMYTKHWDAGPGSNKGKAASHIAESCQVLYKKASCYIVAVWFMEGFGKSKGLLIPPGFTTIAEESNAFIALAAYAIGFAGISPPFIKVVGGSIIKNKAEFHLMGGDEIKLNMAEKTKLSIYDPITTKGFDCHMKLQGGSSTYAVTLGFKFGGDQLKIEVTQIK